MISLDDLLCGLSRSVQNAQRSMQEEELQTFLRYFEQEDAQAAASGTSDAAGAMLSPKVQAFSINEGNPSLKVPLVALAGHRPLSLDTVRIVMNVTAKADSSGIQVELGPGEDADGQRPYHQLSLEFKQGDSAEGVSRMLDAFNQFI